MLENIRSSTKLYAMADVLIATAICIVLTLDGTLRQTIVEAERERDGLHVARLLAGLMDGP